LTTLKLLLNVVEVADEFITSKNADFTRFFIIKPTRPGRLKKQIWLKKTSVGALPGHMRRNAHVDLSPYLLTVTGDMRCKMLLIYTYVVHQEISKTRHQRGLCMRISASIKPKCAL